MHLKFSFDGASASAAAAPSAGSSAPGGAPEQLPLLSGAGPVSNSSVLELRVTRGDGAGAQGAVLVCEALSGDGVSYGRAERELTDPTQLATGVRSALARVGPEMPEPLLESVTAVVLSLGGGEIDVLLELGIAVDPSQDPAAVVDEALQARTGVAAGTPIRIEHRIE